jgi:hypothetical protein
VDALRTFEKVIFLRLLNSDERMLAGVGRIAGVCPTAKPLWSEVMIFLELLLRQSGRSPEEKAVYSLEKNNLASILPESPQ